MSSPGVNPENEGTLTVSELAALFKAGIQTSPVLPSGTATRMQPPWADWLHPRDMASICPFLLCTLLNIPL